MNGAEVLIETAIEYGIDVCFANPGTTEIPLVSIFDRYPLIRPVLGLFEGVCTGAADGYARMTDRPAMTLLHLGPGFANGIANLHNARRAGVPVVNVIGDHASWHRSADPPLAMDIEGLAGPVSAWLRANRSVTTTGKDMAEAISASLFGLISTLIVPHDHLISKTDSKGTGRLAFTFDPVDEGSIQSARRLFKEKGRVALILGGRGAKGKGLEAAARIKAATRCDLFTQTFPSCIERGAGLPDVERIPYFPEPARERLSGYQGVVLAGLQEPVTFFGYQGIPSTILREEQQKVFIGMGNENVVEALEHLADEVAGRASPSDVASVLAEPGRPSLPVGRLTAEKACTVLAALQPEGAIIVDEGITSSLAYHPLTRGCPRHNVMGITGGSIGYGMPCAAGAALACPERPVINLQADGSALYTVQALWTQAREGLNVTTLICSNRSYNIVKVELARAGIASPGPKALSLADLDHPAIDWPRLAGGFGVPAVSVDTAEDLARHLSTALLEPGPHLIEMVL